MRILIIDDDLDSAESLADALYLNNFEIVDIGRNGKEALSLYQKHHPDIVLMDMMMPDFDGIDGLKGIREYDPDAKIIFVTADITKKSEKSMIYHNASAVIYKPYDFEDIFHTMKQVHEREIELS